MCTCQQRFILASWLDMLEAEKEDMPGLEAQGRRVTFSHSRLCSGLCSSSLVFPGRAFPPQFPHLQHS